MITYIPENRRTQYAVKIEGRTVGHIKLKASGTLSGWAYFPKGDKNGGETFPTLAECKSSLEGGKETNGN